jgi:DNA-directed RNA polymerase beta subunit
MAGFLHCNSNKFYIGRFCVVQSPDGAKCGLVKSLALLSHVTLETDQDKIISVIKAFGVKRFDALALCELTSISKVSIDGIWMAATNEPKKLVKHLRSLRRSLEISFEVKSITLISIL